MIPSISHHPNSKAALFIILLLPIYGPPPGHDECVFVLVERNDSATDVIIY